ncbi:alpha/beta-hydrolase [Phlegmacium glaucopus]|nr:alpha/beta-hydrolase [Phlegmacium glaucopus]
MGIFLSSTSPSTEQQDVTLTEEQRRMYATEKLDNFRWISKVVATFSPYTLTIADRAPVSLHQTLADLGQFAEVAYSAVPIEFLFEYFTLLRQPGYPLETYDALHDAVLVDSFRGASANIPIFIAYRPLLGQLVVAVSGTSSVKQALQDLRVWRCSHPSGRGTVHTGFWTLYQDIKSQAITGIQKGVADYSVREIVLTGHSMGGSMAYLLCLDLLTEHQIWLKNLNVNIKVAVFGAPRTGDTALVEYFQELSTSYQKAHGQDALKEYSLKGYNDGVPALPPARLGYRHFCKEPLYTVGGVLYNIPATESEHSLFHVMDEGNNREGSAPLFPLGGHNYYNGRELERFARRINWLIQAKPMEEGWEDRYTAIVSKVK